jgi:hypothetical protein
MAPEVQHRAPVSFLVLSASVVGFLDFCWLLAILTRSANDDTPVTWRLVAIATGLCAASAGLTTYPDLVTPALPPLYP